MALQDMEGVLHNGMANGSCASSRKRLRMDVDQENEMEQLKQVIAVRGKKLFTKSISFQVHVDVVLESLIQICVIIFKSLQLFLW